jgi:hypothetical protein
MLSKIRNAIRLFFLRRALQRLQQEGFIALDEQWTKAALSSLADLLHLLSSSGFLQDTQGHPRKLHLTKKLDQRSALIRFQLQQAENRTTLFLK